MIRKKNIGIMYAISFFQGMVFYSAIATLYRQAAGISVFQITLMESISLALSVLLELPWGIVAEKIGYKHTMVICCLLYFLSKVVFYEANGFGMFLLERILLSIVIAGLSGVDESILYLSSEEAKVQSVFGIYSSIGTAGMLIAAGVYSLFLSGNYRLSALLTAVVYGIATILCLFLDEVKEPEKEEKSSVIEFWQILKETIGRKELLCFLVSVALFSEMQQTITVFLNQLQYVRCGMTDNAIGWAYVVMTVAGLTGAWSDKLTVRLGKRKTGVLLLGLGLVCCLFLAFSTNAMVSVLAIICIRVAFSLMMPLVSLLENEQVHHENRATALSINAVMMDGVAIATNLIFGKLADESVNHAMIAGAVFCLVAVIGFSYSCKKFRQESRL